MRESVNCREDPKVPLVKIEFEIMVKYAVLCLVTQSCPTLCDPMGCSPPGFSVHRILQARTPEWDLPDPGMEPESLVAYIGRWILYY